VPNDLGPQMARLESLLRQGSGQLDPMAIVLRYFFAFAASAVVVELVFAAVGFGWLAPPVFDRVGMFCLGLSCAALTRWGSGWRRT